MPNLNNEKLFELLQEKQQREQFNRFFYLFPDKDNFNFLGEPSGKLFSRDKYSKHLDFFKAGASYRQRIFCAGNRVGKSFAGLYEIVCHATGNYPEWWDGRKFNRPVTIWISGFSYPMMKNSVMRGLLGARGEYGSGMLPKNSLIGEPRAAPNVPDAVSSCRIKHISGGQSTIEFKTYESGLEGHAGAAVDIILLDEEPPLKIYTECLMRTATTGGVVMTTFTPDRGFSETVLSFFDNGEFHEGRVGEKWVTVCAWDDVPHLDLETKRELWASIPPHLREAKTKGVPYLGSGAIYPVLEAEIVTTPFKIPIKWAKAFGLDVGWNRTAAIWAAYNEEDDTIYIYSEYYRGQAEPSVHASAIKTRGDWMTGVIDKASRGRSQVDGEKLIDLYTNLGLRLVPSVESRVVEAGLQNTLERLSTGRLKVFNTCVNWLNEFRIYRRDENGKIIKKNDHLMDATRYLIDAFPFIRDVEPQEYEDNTEYSNRDANPVGGY